ncbi:MAG: nitroreductase family protein [Clostridia bacterium]|nr:nitroreductase family protein [Clostridia bacterium]
MELQKVLKERYSVRIYDSRPIEDEKLTRILEAGNAAPTAKNQQPQRIYVLKSEEAIQKIRAITRCAFNAPVVLIFAYDAEAQWRNPFEQEIVSGQQDVSIVATQVMLAAWDEGIGSCWVNYFPNSEVEKAFELPENEKVVLLMPMGYPAPEAGVSPNHGKRKPLEDTVKTL